MCKKLHKLTVGVLFVLSAVFICLGFASIKKQEVVDAAVAVVWSEISIEEDLCEGDTFTVPKRTVTVGENTCEASAVVTFPDGTKTISQSFVLKTAGKYSIKYTAIVGGRPRSMTETFFAQYKMVRTYSSETSLEYGSHAYAPNMNGLVVRLTEGDSLLFNDIIDISDNTVNDILFEGFVTSDAAPTEYDFKRLFVQFTDVEDSNNYFKVRFIRSGNGPTYPYTYILAGGNGQPLTGWEAGTNKLWVEGDWGAVITHAFNSSYDKCLTTERVGEYKMNISYDAATKTVYVNNVKIVDLDDPQYFDTLWDGFTSGRVRMSVWAEDYSSDTANFVITKAGEGFDLTARSIEEKTPPVLTVHTDYDKDDMPEAKVGMSYSVPSATAFDEYSGVCSVQTEVYYNYTSATNAMKIDVVNGKFSVDYEGDYSIIYTATDYMGNAVQEIYWISASLNPSLATITLLGDIPEMMNAGELIILPESSVSGGSGLSTVKIYANDGSGDVELVDGAFRPNAVSVHKIKYVATDYIGQVVVLEQSIIVNGGTAPLFIDKPELPKYFFAGYTYTIPELYANDYTSGKLVRRLATITVTDAKGTYEITPGASYVPEVVNHLDPITITYTVDSVTYSVVIPTVKAVDSKGLNMGNYFIVDGANIETKDDYALFTATSADASWTFANKLVAEELSVALKANPTTSNYSGLKFTLTDAVDSNVSITAQILKSGDKSIISTDTFKAEINLGFTSNSKSNLFTITYKNGAISVDGNSLGVKNSNNGESFKGFPSNFVYVSVEMIQAATGSAYSIVTLNKQPICNMTQEYMGPKIVVLGEKGGTKAYGTKLVLPAAMAGDVFDPNVTFTLTVKDPVSGKPVTSTSGLLLKDVDPTKEYEIELNVYGQFKVEYVATDSNGNRTKLPYAINVDDDKGPQITFAHAFQKTAKVGDVLIIPDFSVVDNYCAVEKIVVSKYCLTPTGCLITLPDDSNAVRAQYAGTYIFRIIVTDADGNKTMCRMSIVVTE